MSDYSYNDMFRLQNEAKKRVMEMQKRSREVAESFNSGLSGGKDVKNSVAEEDLPRVPKAISYPAELHSVQQKQPSVQRSRRGNPNVGDIRKAFQSVFGDLSADDYEKMFILSLCLLLTKESKDDSLIFSLMYLLT